jgi:hypothetical protein
MRAQTSSHHRHLFSAAVLWLCVGGFLLLTTLVPAHTAMLGWTPTFWLLGAPLVVLLALDPGLLRQLLRRRVRRLEAVHAVHGVIWH